MASHCPTGVARQGGESCSASPRCDKVMRAARRSLFEVLLFGAGLSTPPGCPTKGLLTPQKCPAVRREFLGIQMVAAECSTEENVASMERYQISAEGGIYFITMSVVEWLPVFVSEHSCRILTDSLNFCHAHKGLRINAYVIMPTHFHGIVFLQRFDPSALKAALTALRKFTGRQLSEYCTSRMPDCSHEVLVKASGEDRDRRFWQPTVHPERIESEPFYRQKRDYLHDNPCRRGLVRRQEHWRFSSASYWLSDGQVANDVVLNPIEW